MSDSDSHGGCLAVVLFIGMVASWIGSGIVAWNWIDPDSLGEGVLFLITWGILGKVFDLAIGAILMGLGNLFE